jgi:large subunit ribosomal protein L17
MAAALFQYETISTTPQKAKEIKPFVEKLITLAKKGDLSARRKAIKMLGGDRDIVVQEDGEPVKQGTVVRKLFSELGPRFLDRPGGYTRIIRLSLKRMGDKGRLVLLQLIGENEKVEEKTGKTEDQAETSQQTVTAEPAEETAEFEQVQLQESTQQTEQEDSKEKNQQPEDQQGEQEKPEDKADEQSESDSEKK